MTKEFFAEEKGQRLDVFLMERLPDFSRSHIKNLIEKELVKVDGKSGVKAGLSLKIGQKIEVEWREPEKISTAGEDISLNVVYEDGDLLVINKPQGLVVHPCSSTKSGTLVNALLFHVKDLSGINGELRPGIVHRLDKDTSGLLVVAKNDLAHKSLAEQIKNKTARRCYLALVEGYVKENDGRIETFLKRDPKDRKKISVQVDGRIAITDFKVLERFEKCTLMEFSLLTGRTHQIRVQSKFIHHPVVGDKLYGHEIKGLEGQLLHAYKLSFTHPRTGREMCFEAPLPQHFAEYLKKQKKLEIE
ncbi:MAG: RluA family pseudouridine synthase [Clostridia bacterium]|nr:RluA family pseudouridine synthase [Clostridia bacterium]